MAASSKDTKRHQERFDRRRLASDPNVDEILDRGHCLGDQ